MNLKLAAQCIALHYQLSIILNTFLIITAQHNFEHFPNYTSTCFIRRPRPNTYIYCTYTVHCTNVRSRLFPSFLLCRLCSPVVSVPSSLSCICVLLSLSYRLCPVVYALSSMTRLICLRGPQVSLVGLEKALQAYCQGPAEQPFDLRSVPVAEARTADSRAAAPEGSIASSRKPDEKVSPAQTRPRRPGGIHRLQQEARRKGESGSDALPPINPISGRLLATPISGRGVVFLFFF